MYRILSHSSDSECVADLQEALKMSISILRGDEDITSMDTTSPIHWSWSSTYFRTARKHLLAHVELIKSYEASESLQNQTI
jgi:hypothetical protein